MASSAIVAEDVHRMCGLRIFGFWQMKFTFLTMNWIFVWNLIWQQIMLNFI